MLTRFLLRSVWEVKPRPTSFLRRAERASGRASIKKSSAHEPVGLGSGVAAYGARHLFLNLPRAHAPGLDSFAPPALDCEWVRAILVAPRFDGGGAMILGELPEAALLGDGLSGFLDSPSGPFGFAQGSSGSLGMTMERD